MATARNRISHGLTDQGAAPDASPEIAAAQRLCRLLCQNVKQGADRLRLICVYKVIFVAIRRLVPLRGHQMLTNILILLPTILILGIAVLYCRAMLTADRTEAKKAASAADRG